MNTNSLQHAAPAVNREYSLLAAFEQWKFGWDLHTAGEPVHVCQTIQQRRGWFTANAAEAAGTLPAGCADRMGI